MRAALPLACLLAACSSEPEILGFYATTYHVADGEGCDEAGAEPVEDPPYFHLVEDKFFGFSFVTARPCTGESEDDCGSSSFANFFIKRSGAWIGEIHASSGGVGGAACNLNYFLDRAVLEDDGMGGETIRIESVRYGEQDETLTGDDCDPDEAERRGTAMPCQTLQVIEGLRLR